MIGVLTNQLPAWSFLADGVIIGFGPLGTCVLRDVGGKAARPQFRGRWLSGGYRPLELISTAEEHSAIWCEVAVAKRDQK